MLGQDRKSTDSTREQLLDVAEKLFLDRGHDEVSLRAIVREACALLARAPFLLCREDKAFRNFLGQFGQSLLASDRDSRRARRGGSFRGRRAELFFNNLVDQLAAMLTAPISVDTRSLLDR